MEEKNIQEISDKDFEKLVILFERKVEEQQIDYLFEQDDFLDKIVKDFGTQTYDYIKGGLEKQAADTKARGENRARGIKRKNLIRKISYFAIAAATIYAAHKIYKQYLSKAAIACKNSKNKEICMKEYRRKAIQQEIRFLQSKLSYCQKSSNPEKCRQKINEKIKKKHDELVKI